MNVQYNCIPEANSVEAVTPPPTKDPKTVLESGTIPPKLTMKMLYTMLTELRQESTLIAGRVDQIEHRLCDMLQAAEGAAAAAEDVEVEPLALVREENNPLALETEYTGHLVLELGNNEHLTLGIDVEVEPCLYEHNLLIASSAPIMEPQDAPPVIQTFRFVSRSERHPKVVPGFWEKLFRRLTGASRKELMSP